LLLPHPGRAKATPGTPGKRPWPFRGGTIKRLAVDVSGDPYRDLEREAQAMLMRE
jgi:arylsulfatase